MAERTWRDFGRRIFAYAARGLAPIRMRVFIANFGEQNYLWPECRRRNTVATFDDADVHRFWEARDRAGYIEYSIAHKTTVRGAAPTRPVASRWYGLTDTISQTAGDIWIHREKAELWWTTTTDDPVQIDLRPSNNPKRHGPNVYEVHKPCTGWSNRDRRGAGLSWDALHPKARDFLFTEGTLQQLSPDNAAYAEALVDGSDLSAWHDQASWKAKVERARRNPATLFDARRKAIWRMVDTCKRTVLQSNGQQVLRNLKNKELRMSEAALTAYLDQLISDQDGLCALTGIQLQYDGEYDDAELLCSLDRIDSDGHYEPGNLQVVCRFANRWKGDGKDEGFRRLIGMVRETSF